MNEHTLITLDDVVQARARLQGVTNPTPLVVAPPVAPGMHAWFKPESLQPVGSFKIRGAYNRLAALSPEARAAGVIAYSSGNHAQGVAYAAQLLGINAVIVMPNSAPRVKIEATQDYGARVVLYDPATEQREEVARRLMEGQSWTLVPPFNDPYVIAGQGTVGLEIVEALPEVDLVLVPVGGGGLISGVATVLKQRKPSAKIIGVEPEVAADAQASLRQGKIVSLSAAEVGRTIADGVRTLALGPLTFAHMQHWVDDIVTVTEAEIRAATRRLLLQGKLLAEPTGALSFAALLFHRAQLPPAANIVMVISGGNIEPTQLLEILQEAPG